MKNNHTPEIRFAGFSGDWEQLKLGEVVEIKDSARISNTLWVSRGVPYLRSSDLANDEIEGELFISDETYQSYKDKTGAPEKDDVLFTSGGKVGVTYHKIDDNPVYVQGGSILYAKTSTSSKLSGIYLKAFFSSPMMTKYMEGASTGLTIKHFTLKPANAAPIFISSLKEQNAIGEFFKQLDDTIAFHQQELTTLKQTKQGFLQKMFPKKGESMPEIRFPGFTEDWEQRKFGEIFDVHTDFVSNGSFQALKDNVKLYTQENYAYMIRLQDASNNWKGPWLYTDKKGFDFLKKSTVYENDILMSDRGTIGKFFQVPKLNKPMTLSSNAVLLRSSKNDNSFIYYMLNTENIKNQIVIRTTPGVQPMISKTEFKKILSSLPLIDEQQKIGSFFKQLDDTITLHQRELDALQETKKAFLQKMFA
ncbi:hypothetical protein COI73_08140 [Bacillus cereus]|nr:hypothetical protein COI73_08140 [Bacillus cereus]